MQITQSLVELLNARLKDLMYEVSMFNAIELGEDLALDGIYQVKQSLLDQMSAKFGRDLDTSEEVQQELERIKDQLRITVQIDYMSEEFKKIGATDKVTVNLEILKEKNLKELMKVLGVDESEVE